MKNSNLAVTAAITSVRVRRCSSGDQHPQKQRQKKNATVWQKLAKMIVQPKQVHVRVQQKKTTNPMHLRSRT